MAKIPVDEAPAGPELDAAVAKVLGWTEIAFFVPSRRYLGVPPGDSKGDCFGLKMHVPKFSSEPLTLCRAFLKVHGVEFVEVAGEQVR